MNFSFTEEEWAGGSMQNGAKAPTSEGPAWSAASEGLAQVSRAGVQGHGMVRNTGQRMDRQYGEQPLQNFGQDMYPKKKI